MGVSIIEQKDVLVFSPPVSYSNTFVEKVAPNEFLVLYNNLKYDEGDGVHHKAAFVKRIRLERD